VLNKLSTTELYPYSWVIYSEQKIYLLMVVEVGKSAGIWGGPSFIIPWWKAKRERERERERERQRKGY
jgi:hypothetical protein